MQLYAIHYGENFKYGTYQSVYQNTDTPEKLIQQFAFTYYLAKRNGKVILFDTGFRQKEMADHMGITLFDVSEEVANLVTNPYSVDIIFITHNHFDHIDNLDLYDASMIVLSRATYNEACKDCADTIREKLQSKQICIVDDEVVIDDMFHFKVIGGHAPGSSVIYFKEKEQEYVITGDECYVCDNMKHNLPIGICVDREKNADFIQDGYDKKLIPLPFHDKEIYSQYGKVSEHIVEICS